MWLVLLTSSILLILTQIVAFCPAIFKKELPYDYWVVITNDLPQNKTILVDDWEGDTVCDFKGRPGKHVWPLTQIDLNTNSNNYQVKYNNSGTADFGYLEAFWKPAKGLLQSSKLSGERCGSDREWYIGYCNTTGRCGGIEAGEVCTTTAQCVSGYYCKSNICTVVESQGAACTSDDAWAIDSICARSTNTCQYLFYQVENTTVSDARMCQSGVKRNAPGTNGECRTTDFVQQNSANLTFYKCSPDSANTCALISVTNQLYPENSYNDFTQLAYTVGAPTDCHCLLNTTGYCMPYGGDSWMELNDYWVSNIVSKLRTHCHQSRRFNPIAWVEWEANMDKTRFDYWIDMLFNLTNHVYFNDEHYFEFISTINMYSPRNWAKINSAQAWTFITFAGLLTVVINFM